MRFRAYKPADFASLIKLSKLFGTSPFTFDVRLRKRLVEYKSVFIEEIIKSKDVNTIVAENNDNEVIGYVSFSKNTVISSIAGTNIGNILLIAVSKEYQHFGIAKQLLIKALNILKIWNTELVVVGTDLYNIPAIRLYEGADFRMIFSWSIFRIFPDRIQAEICNKIDAASSYDFSVFYDRFTRPISFLKDGRLNTTKIKDYIWNNTINSIRKGATITLALRENEELKGVINARQDKLAMRSFGADNIYIIRDVLAMKKNEGTEKTLLTDFIARLHKFEYVEIWIDSSDSYMSNILQDIGFYHSYTGVVFHKWI